VVGRFFFIEREKFSHKDTKRDFSGRKSHKDTKRDYSGRISHKDTKSTKSTKREEGKGKRDLYVSFL
jgi:hypothetical protein